MATLNERLILERGKKKVSQEAVAKAIGISWRAYNRYESGERSPKIESLVALADYFGVSADYLLGRSDKP